MPLSADGPAPYAPAAPLLQVIERYRDRGLQAPFTTEVLARAGVSDSLTNRVLQAFKLLGLIEDDGNPAPVLQEYARVPQEEARALLEQAVREAYAPIFAFANPATDAPDRIRDAFRGYEPRGQQERMVTLFLGLCEYVGIIAETPKRQASPKPSRPRNPKPADGAPSGRSGKGSKADAAAQAGTLPAAVEGLVRELAQSGPTWDRARRDKFMAMWDAVIDFSFPVHEPVAGNGSSP